MLFQTYCLAKLKQHQARKNLSYTCRSTGFSKEKHYRKKTIKPTQGFHPVAYIYRVCRVAPPEEGPILLHAGFGYRISICLQPTNMCIPSYLHPNTSPAQDCALPLSSHSLCHHLCNSCNIKQNVVPMPFREKLLKTNENSPFIGLFSPPPQNFVSNKLDKEFYASSFVGEKKNCHYSYFQKHVYPLLASGADRS